ncbi:hypothetical protein B0H16DRAFT_1468916 [Mycena metata]|uniref:Uncharacterized protein n=1 Tax=Mycena metata TaxID=1033252 RepID=A0AAD7I0Z6_9AGAR|nr:hypothetical protein B0H16DRAFT_1468916 [Mycena metata]
MATLKDNRYQAETRLIKLLRDYCIRSVQDVRVVRPTLPSRYFLLRPWNFKLLMASLLVACLGFTPYIHFSVRKHTTFPALAVFFPWCRVVGGMLCVFPGQLLLQYRIERILKQRLLFMGINELPLFDGLPLKVPTQFIRVWDETRTSEKCLSSLFAFIQSSDAETSNVEPFIQHLARALHLDFNQNPKSLVTEVAKRLKPYVTNTWAWVLMQVVLLCGSLMTIVGYIGCFTIVQNSADATDTYIWLGAEAALALLRLLVWALNPPWDDSDGVWLILDCAKDNKCSLQDRLGTTQDEAEPETFKVVSEGVFLEALTAHSGPVDINAIPRITGFRRSYSWITRVKTASRTEDALFLILNLENRPGTTLCTVDHSQVMQFYYADNISAGLAVAKRGLLDENHPLMKAPSQFILEVFDLYHFVSSRAGGDSKHRKSALSLVDSTDTNTGNPSLEAGEPSSDTIWQEIKICVDETIGGIPLSYDRFRRCRETLAKNSSPVERTKKIYSGLTPRADGRDLSKGYDQEWWTYAGGALALNRLFKSINSDLGQRSRSGGDKNRFQTVEQVAFTEWNINVLRPLSSRLRDNPQLGQGVDRALRGFTSQNITIQDLSNMQIQTSLEDPARDAAIHLTSIGGRGGMGLGPTFFLDEDRRGYSHSWYGGGFGGPGGTQQGRHLFEGSNIHIGSMHLPNSVGQTSGKTSLGNKVRLDRK